MEKIPSRSDDLDQIAQELEERSPQEILAWAVETYRPRLTLACSFGGASGMVLLDMVMHIAPATPVFYLETGFLFSETHHLIAEAQRTYGITPQAVQSQLSVVQQAAEYGEALWERDPDRCCELREVIPQHKALKGFDAWITGLRRDQASTRKATPVVAWDNSLGWSRWRRWPAGRNMHLALIYENGVPGQPAPRPRLSQHWLYELYTSHCAREGLRAGRWSGFTKTECGLHSPS